MPNFYTHLRFAQQVGDALPAKLRLSLQAEWDSFLLGNFGPDPLYFAGKRLREQGLSLHNGSGTAALSRYRQAIAQDKPYARSFAAGYFLHFLLDSRMHPLIYAAMEQTDLTHRNLEGELDRLFLNRDDKDPKEIFPSLSMPEPFYMTAARMAPGVSPVAYAQGVKNFRRVSLMLRASTGTPLRYAANGLSYVTKIGGIRGSVLSRTPAASARPWLHRLDGRYQDTLAHAPQALESFIIAAETGQDFDPLLTLNFSGKKDV